MRKAARLLLSYCRSFITSKPGALLLGYCFRLIIEWWNRHHARQLWREAKFHDRVQAALYFCTSKTHLKRVEKRTLFEDSLAEVLSNSEAARLVIAATGKCTENQPFVTQHISKTNRYPILNALLNRLSACVAQRHLEYEISSGVDSLCNLSEWFVFALVGYSSSSANSAETAVPYDRRSAKTRLFVIREDRLRELSMNLCSKEERDYSISERHRHRIFIMRKMAEIYALQNQSDRHLLRLHLGCGSKPHAKHARRDSLIKSTSMVSPLTGFRMRHADRSGVETFEESSPVAFTPHRPQTIRIRSNSGNLGTGIIET